MNELLLNRYDDILKEIVRWRCITSSDLKKIIAESETSLAFRKKILRLEKGGVINSEIFRGFNKIIFPSQKLINTFGITHFNEDSKRHDAIVSSVSIGLSRYKIVDCIELPHEYKTKSTWKLKVIEPDAIVTILKGGRKIKVGLEIELWSKNNKKVYEKFLDYAKADEYEYVFYFFQSESVFKSYQLRQKELVEMDSYSHLHEKLKNKIVFILNSTMAKRLEGIDDSKTIFKGNELKLIDILGEKSVT